MRRPSIDEWGLHLAEVVATRGTCIRRQVGCALLNSRGRLLSVGYNGPAADRPHCAEEIFQSDSFGNPLKSEFPNACKGAYLPSGEGLDTCQAIHAEANALLQCAAVDKIATAYVTVAPCVNCVKMLMNTSCRRIVFGQPYAAKHAEAEVWWRDAGREWIDGSGGAFRPIPGQDRGKTP